MFSPEEIVKYFYSISSRQNSCFLTHWREARKYAYPAMQDFLSPGDNGADNIFDTTAIEARKRLSSGLIAWNTPPDKRWFSFQAQDDEIAEDDEVKSFFMEVDRITYTALYNSNFPLMHHDALDNAATTGDAALYVERGDRNQLNFLAVASENFFYDEDNEGRPSSVFRLFEFTAKQMKMEFSSDLPAQVEAELAKPDSSKTFKIIHAVLPNLDYVQGGRRFDEMAFRSFYIELESKTLLSEGGYDFQPYIILRFSKKDNEIRGRSPTMEYIQEIKMLNRMREVDLQATEKAVEPPVLISEGSLVSDNFLTDPGSINYIRSTGVGDVFPQPFFTGENIPQLENKILESREIIRRANFNDMFDALGDQKNMSATEVVQRVSDRTVPFVSTLGRLQSEFYSPLLEAIFVLLYRQGAYPEVPKTLQENPEYKINYSNRLTMALKQLHNLGYSQTMELITPLLQLNPAVAENFNMDAIVRDIMRNNGGEADWLIPEEEVAARRQAQQEAMQKQQAMEQLQQISDAAPKLGKTIEKNSPLEIMGVNSLG